MKAWRIIAGAFALSAVCAVAQTTQVVDLPTRVGHDAFLVETAKVSDIVSAALD